MRISNFDATQCLCKFMFITNYVKHMYKLYNQIPFNIYVIFSVLLLPYGIKAREETDEMLCKWKMSIHQCTLNNAFKTKIILRKLKGWSVGGNQMVVY